MTEQLTGAMLMQALQAAGASIRWLPVNPDYPSGDKVPCTDGAVPLYKIAEAINAAAWCPNPAPEVPVAELVATPTSATVHITTPFFLEVGSYPLYLGQRQESTVG